MAYNKQALINLAVQAARSQGLDPRIFVNQIRQESGFAQDVVTGRRNSSAGAQGIAQFMPATARSMGVNPLNPRSALYGAARMDAANLRKYGNWKDVLSLYNSGKGWAQGRNIGQTNHYVKAILGGGPGVVSRARTPAQDTSFSGGQGGMDHGGDQRNALASFLSANLSSFAATGHVTDSNALPFLLASQQSQGDSGASSGTMKPSAALTALRRGGYKGTPMGEMLDAQAMAKKMGLKLGENLDAGGVNPVHVKGSYHYQKYAGGKVSRATDISGSPQQMAAFYKWARSRYGKKITELFYDPLGGIKNGNQIGAIGGHRDHVHIAF